MKQVIVIRADLKLPKGKAAAQAAHAAVEAMWRADKETVKQWRQEGMAKIVLKIADEKALLQLLQQAKDAGLATALITDAGKTVVAPGTTTCMAAGPADEETINHIFGSLQLL